MLNKYYYATYTFQKNDKSEQMISSFVTKGTHPFKHVHDMMAELGGSIIILSWQRISKRDYEEFGKWLTKNIKD